MTLALFDLDNTLIGGDSDYLWGDFLVSRSVVDPVQYQKRNKVFYQDYVSGNLDAEAYLRFALSPLVNIEPAQLSQLHKEFMLERIEPIWLPAAESLVEKHRSAGDKLAVITATNRFVVEPIVRRLGIDQLICSEPELIDGRYTGDFVGTPCFAEGKITKIREWLSKSSQELNGQELGSAWFYSDSHNDLPLLKKVANPVAVDPDDKLKETADRQGWSIISLR